MAEIEMLNKAWLWLFRRKYLLLFFSILFLVYLANTYHTNFPDEFDNITGGWYINHGILPYTGFFAHHNPAAYYIASLITLFTKQSFVQFRIVWTGLLFTASVVSFVYLRRLFGTKSTRFFLLYLMFLGISATYYWGHMLLSETVVGYALIPAYALVFLKYIRRERLSLFDIWCVSILSALGLLTSFTFIFAIAGFLIFTLIYFMRCEGLFSRNTLGAVLILVSPYLLFLIYLVTTKSLHEFYFQSIYYNREYYIYNFPTVAGKVSKHPLRHAASIFYNVSNDFALLLLQVRDFNFSFPVNISLFVGNAALLIYLFLKREYRLAAFIYYFLVYLNARSEPLNSAETDFHSTVYIMVSLFHLAFVFFKMAEEYENVLTNARKLLYQILLIIISIYGVFLINFFYRSFAEKVYTKVMGQMPRIYDAPVAAPIINKIVSRDEYFWIGPLEFQELLYINGKLPSKYHWFLPASSRSDKIKTEIIQDLTKNRPKVIVFKEDYTIFGVKPQEFNSTIVKFLREHYFRLEDLEKEGKKYTAAITGLHNFDIEQNFYFDKQIKDEILDLLLRENIIKPVE